MAHMPTSPAPGINPVAPEVNFLTSARSLPVDRSAFDQWRTGLSSREVGNMTAGVWPGKAPVSETDKDAATTPTVSDFTPFIIYTYHRCEQPVIESQIRSEALAKLEAVTPTEMAREFWTGASDATNNPLCLVQSASDTTATGSVKEVVNAVLREYETASNGAEAFLHVPTEAMYDLFDASFVSRSGNRLVTPHGHTVIPGPGYPSTGDYGPDGSASAAAGEAWIYVTSPVEAAVGAPFVVDSMSNRGSYDRTDLVEVFAERWGIYRFETTTAFAGLATY